MQRVHGMPVANMYMYCTCYVHCMHAYYASCTCGGHMAAVPGLSRARAEYRGRGGGGSRAGGPGGDLLPQQHPAPPEEGKQSQHRGEKQKGAVMYICTC